MEKVLTQDGDDPEYEEALKWASLLSDFMDREKFPARYGAAAMSRMLCNLYQDLSDKEKYFAFLETCKQLWDKDE